MFSSTYDHLPEAVLRAAGHWDSQHRRISLDDEADDGRRPTMSIAVSREEGAPAPKSPPKSPAGWSGRCSITSCWSESPRK